MPDKATKYEPPKGEPASWHDPFITDKVVDGPASIAIGDKNHIDCYDETEKPTVKSGVYKRFSD